MFWKFIQKLWKRPVKNSYFTKVAGSFPKTYLILSSLAIFQRFYIIFKKSFKTQSFVKFPKQLFQEHISLTISVTVNLIFFFITLLVHVWPMTIAFYYHEDRFWSMVDLREAFYQQPGLIVVVSLWVSKKMLKQLFL